MSDIYIVAERPIAAPAERVYGYFADHREHHHRFLPPAFSNFAVESGGVGEGTVSRFRVTTGRQSRDYRVHVTEPSPGRVLMETDPDAGTVTTFTVTPRDGESTVRIETSYPAPTGIVGFFERLFAPPVMRRLYRDELNRLDRYAREQR
jgi:uncharacterized protein YndB with AHSA1/START domain